MKLKKAKYSALEVAYYIINYGYKNNIVIKLDIYNCFC